jgi:hypothetical protein
MTGILNDTSDVPPSLLGIDIIPLLDNMTVQGNTGLYFYQSRIVGSYANSEPIISLGGTTNCGSNSYVYHLVQCDDYASVLWTHDATLTCSFPAQGQTDVYPCTTSVSGGTTGKYACILTHGPTYPVNYPAYIEFYWIATDEGNPSFSSQVGNYNGNMIFCASAEYINNCLAANGNAYTGGQRYPNGIPLLTQTNNTFLP